MRLRLAFFSAPALITPSAALAAEAPRAASESSLSGIIGNPALLLDFLATTLGKSLLIFVFFGAIILFLRFLYGPRGIFRDPAWDKDPATEKNTGDNNGKTQKT